MPISRSGGTASSSASSKLSRRHPLRERLARQQMLALYRSERQTEALRSTANAAAPRVDPRHRAAPSRCGRLEQRDPEARRALSSVLSGRPARSVRVVVVPSRDDRTEPLIQLAAPLVRGRELVVARLVSDEGELA